MIGFGLITREEIEKARARAGIKEESAASKLIKLLEKLEEAGVDVSKLPRSGKKDKTLLKNIKAKDKEGKEVDISKIVKEMPNNYNIGDQISKALQAAKRKGNTDKRKGTVAIKKEEIEKLIGFGLITREEIEKARARAGTKEESAASKLIKLLEKLEEAGVDVSKLPRSGKKDKTLLKNIKAKDKEGNEIDISEIVKEMPDDYNIGNQTSGALQAAKGVKRNYNRR